jgi:acyl carrier protein
LQVGRIGRDQDFFAAGGSSLSALQMLHRVKTRFGVTITVRQFFGAPTVAGVAANVERALAEQLAALSDGAERGAGEG